MARGGTRVTHTVRCRADGNSALWIDVEVLDAITLLGPGGQETLLWIRPEGALPFIKDETGDGNGKGSADNCTRASHMERVSSPDDPFQFFDIEVLDAIAFKEPAWGNKSEGLDKQASAAGDLWNYFGKPASGHFGYGREMVLYMPKASMEDFIVDGVGLGLQKGNNGLSRACHVNLVTEKGNTDDRTDQSDAIPPKLMGWCATIKTDGINFLCPQGGNICMIVPPSGINDIDRTVYGVDAETGEPAPPDNTDPNHYIKFPKAKPKTTTSPATLTPAGASVKIPKEGPIKQGLFWWIKRISAPFNPWFWYATVQEPKAFSFFGNPGSLGSWGYRGFQLFNFYPVIWILSSNNPLEPLGSFGSPSIDLCARFGNWDFSFRPVPSAPVGIPPRPANPTYFPPLTGLAFEGEFELHSEGTATYAPFGCLQMTSPPLGPFPNQVPYGNHLGGNDGSEIFSGLPNVWQLTGATQPDRVDPSKPWNPFLNPYTPPSSKIAKTTANTWANMWNAAADGHNGFIPHYAPNGKSDVYSVPPGWEYAIPYHAATEGLRFFGSYQGGIPYGVATSIGLPLVDFIPATAYNIAVGQLDVNTWDTTKLELYSNPLNWFLPIILPPLLKPGKT